MAHAQALRARCFGRAETQDKDRFDSLCQHVLVEHRASGTLVCTFRMMTLQGDRLASGYCAQFYDLSRLTIFDAAVVEIGRFCVDAEHRDPDILRIAWGMMTRYVEASGAGLLIGCTSFAGTDPARYRDSFALLRARHLAPREMMPQVKAAEVYRFGRLRRRPDRHKGLRQMPPLLRSYLSMGGCVSDHAVVDREMDTLHVFTAVDVSAIPEARKRLLRTVT
jgi:putative hemolysin